MARKIAVVPVTVEYRDGGVTFRSDPIIPTSAMSVLRIKLRPAKDDWEMVVTDIVPEVKP